MTVGRVAGNTETTRVSPAPRPNSRGEPEQRERLGALGAYPNVPRGLAEQSCGVAPCHAARGATGQTTPHGTTGHYPRTPSRVRMPEPFAEFYRAIRGGGEAMYRDWWK